MVSSFHRTRWIESLDCDRPNRLSLSGISLVFVVVPLCTPSSSVSFRTSFELLQSHIASEAYSFLCKAKHFPLNYCSYLVQTRGPNRQYGLRTVCFTSDLIRHPTKCAPPSDRLIHYPGRTSCRTSSSTNTRASTTP